MDSAGGALVAVFAACVVPAVARPAVAFSQSCVGGRDPLAVISLAAVCAALGRAFRPVVCRFVKEGDACRLARVIDGLHAVVGARLAAARLRVQLGMRLAAIRLTLVDQLLLQVGRLHERGVGVGVGGDEGCGRRGWAEAREEGRRRSRNCLAPSRRGHASGVGGLVRRLGMAAGPPLVHEQNRTEQNKDAQRARRPRQTRGRKHTHRKTRTPHASHTPVHAAHLQRRDEVVVPCALLRRHVTQRQPLEALTVAHVQRVRHPLLEHAVEAAVRRSARFALRLRHCWKREILTPLAKSSPASSHTTSGYTVYIYRSV